MLKVKSIPMVSVREATKEIADILNFSNKDKAAYHQAITTIFLDICETLTDSNDTIAITYLPEDEDSCIDDYDIECETFFRLVKQATGLNWGDKFLANLE